jgi:hypothetical protein
MDIRFSGSFSQLAYLRECPWFADATSVACEASRIALDEQHGGDVVALGAHRDPRGRAVSFRTRPSRFG